MQILLTSASTWTRSVYCTRNLAGTKGDLQAPLTIQSNSPLELVHQFFVKLGARYVVVTDTDGDCEWFILLLDPQRRSVLTIGIDEGIIDKKTWLAFLSELDERS